MSPTHVMVEERYHRPSDARWTGGVHLHVLERVKIGRLYREAGEALCGKKRGSSETTQAPANARRCRECERRAERYKIRWPSERLGLR